MDAQKIGSIVVLRFAISTAIGGTSNTWYNVGTLNNGVRPKDVVDCVGYDNNSSGVEAVQIKINTNGNMNVWLPANKYAKPYGTVTYVV